MQYSIPDYYKEFACLADACEDTCCAGWQIVADKKSLKRYKAEKGAYKKALRAGIDFRSETFRQDADKRCAFLNEKNLCEMYLHLGADSLCKTCRMYPRHVEEFENVREITLSVSCPEVARILLSRKEPVKFLSVDRDGFEEYGDFDPFLYSQLVEAREVIRSILQDREKDISRRALLVLGLAHDMQVRIEKSELFACEEVWNRYRSKKAEAFVDEKLKILEGCTGKRYYCSRKLYDRLYQLELLREDWGVHLRRMEKILYAGGRDAYCKLQKGFANWLDRSDIDWKVMSEQLLVYFIDTYFCGGVYDGCIYDKVNLSVASVFLIYEMLTAIWSEKGECLTFSDVVKTVYRFSREIEHSDMNIGLMEKWPSLLGFLR